MSKFNFLDLDEKTRELMLSEIQFDIEREMLYLSSRLNEEGINEYNSFLIESVKHGNESTFEGLLDINKYFNKFELRDGKQFKVPSNASTLLCQNEFNKFYIRAICLKAIELEIEIVTVYRARVSSNPRSESNSKIGAEISAKELLEDLRSTIGQSPKLLPEINSGLSVKIEKNNL
jgi:hypothetical protein